MGEGLSRLVFLWRICVAQLTSAGFSSKKGGHFEQFVSKLFTVGVRIKRCDRLARSLGDLEIMTAFLKLRVLRVFCACIKS